MDWPFDQAENVTTVTTKQVMHEGLPVLSVVHYEDDHSWGFYCGTTSKSEDLLLVRMDTIIKVDATLELIADLPPGWSASRKSLKDSWIRAKGE